MNDTALDKIIAALARGNGEWARTYLEHFPREVRTNKVVRERLAEAVHPSVLPALMDLHPWLMDADETLVGRVRALLDEAGAAGVRGSSIARTPGGLAALKELVEAGEVMAKQEATGGRPVETYRLKVHDRRFNPFAK